VINQPEAGLGKIEKNIIGQPFPKLTSKSLAGKVVTLLEALEGKVTLIFIAFVRSAQNMIDSWAQSFEWKSEKTAGLRSLRFQ
jgi:hypothetical protein